jgi:hypothetical protein
MGSIFGWKFDKNPNLIIQNEIKTRENFINII